MGDQSSVRRILELVPGDFVTLVSPGCGRFQAEGDAVEVFLRGIDRAGRLWQGKLALGARGNVRHGKRADRHLHAVLEQRPRAVAGIVRERELMAIPQFRRAARRVRARDDDRTLDVAYLVQLRGQIAVHVDKPVRAERSVVWILVMVAAVGEEADALAVRADAVGVLPHALVDPVPDAAARELVVLVEEVPVFLQVAHPVAHRALVFHLEVRTRIGQLLAQPVERHVLSAGHVRRVVPRAGAPVGRDPGRVGSSFFTAS